MQSLTDHLLATAPDIDAVWRAGVDAALAGVKPHADYSILASVRERNGFAPNVCPLLTPPDANSKLDKAITPSYGLTLHHFRTVLPGTVAWANGVAHDIPTLSLNSCPNAGHCVRVCVLNNGNGRYDSVQRAWRWRTDLLAREPYSFARILAYELVKAIRKHGEILFRPNVNSDVAWELVLPSMTNGYLPGMTSYGYSKLPTTLAHDGWLGSAYRVAYSWNETSDANDVAAFVARGGAVAIVTERRKGAPVLEDLPFDRSGIPVVDADVTDEWIMSPYGVVGDLSAKGKARELIGRSRFVVTTVAA